MFLKKINKLSFLIVIIFTLTSLTAYGQEYITKDIANFKFNEKSVETSQNFYPVTTLKHHNSKTNDLIYTQIIVFNKNSPNKSDLDSWINFKTQKARGTLTIKGNIIFISDDNRFVFWRVNQTYIKITEKYQKKLLNLNPATFTGIPNGTGNFDEDFIAAYLELYPSECNEESCVKEKEKTFEEIYTFDEPENLGLMVSRHFNIDSECPKNGSVDSLKKQINDIKYSEVSDSEFNDIVEQCKNRKRYFIKKIPLPSNIEECYEELNHTLTENSLSTNDRWLIKECYIREYYNERFNSFIKNNTEYYHEAINKRNQEFFDFIKFKSEYKRIDRVTEDGESENSPKKTEPKKIENSSDREQAYDCGIDDCTITRSNKKENSTEKEVVINRVEKKVASKSIIQSIKEKIQGFFEWLS